MNIEIGTTIYTFFLLLLFIFFVSMIVSFIRSVKKRQEQLNRIEAKLDRVEHIQKKQE